MTGPLRFYDSHVHFWDPARTAAYPHLAPDHQPSSFVLGPGPSMKRPFDPQTLRAEAAPVEILGVVHVSATRGRGTYLEETRRVDALGRAAGLPTRIVGSFERGAPIAQVEAELDEQLEVAAFVGVRTIPGPDYSSPGTGRALAAVAERGLVFDALAHPGELTDLARCLERVPSLVCVLEHTGWPLRVDDPEHTRQWREGMRAVAACGPDVYCKLSGLGMPLHAFDVDAMRPWVEFAVETFGADRCVVGSNFPVDGMYGDYVSMLTAYRSATRDAGPSAQMKMFETNAPAIYVRRLH